MHATTAKERTATTRHRAPYLALDRAVVPANGLVVAYADPEASWEALDILAEENNLALVSAYFAAVAEFDAFRLLCVIFAQTLTRALRLFLYLLRLPLGQVAPRG
jgi:predicted secreted protein